VVKVADVAYKEYSLNPDTRFMSLGMGQATDHTNMDIAEGVPPDTTDECTPAQSLKEFHPCAQCLDPAKCASLKFNEEGVRVCPECFDEPVAQDRVVASDVVKTSLSRNFRREMNATGRDANAPEQQQLFDKGLAELVATLPKDQSKGAVYADEYGKEEADGSKEVFKIPIEIVTKQARAQHPQMLTVDAVKSRVATPSSGPVAHAPGNMVITPEVKNKVKYIHCAGVLQLLAMWLSMDSAERKNYVHDFINALDAMHVTRCKIPFYTATKGTEVVAAERLEREFAEALSGKPIEGERGPWDANAERWVCGVVPPLSAGYIYSEETRRLILKITRQYEEKFNVKLQRGPGGVPNIAFDMSTPTDPKAGMLKGYTWNGVAVFCKERHDRTRTKCNKRFPTTNTEIAYFAEMIRAACIDAACIAGTCPSPDLHFLHLPKSLKIRHFLRLSVGHIRHKEEMVLPWPKQPSDISEREESEVVPNVSIETWVENMGKWEYDPAFYDTMFTTLATSSVPKSLYNPDAQLPQSVDKTLALVSNVDDAMEVFLGPSLDLEKLGNADEEEGDDGNAVGGAEGVAAATAAAARSQDDGAAEGEEEPSGVVAGATEGEEEPSGEVDGSSDVRLRNVDYRSPEVTTAGIDNIVTKRDRAYGMVMDVGAQVGYANKDGQFITTDGQVLGRWDATGRVYRVVNALHLPSREPEPYSGSLEVRRATYLDQVANIVDTTSPLFGFVLVDSNGLVGYLNKEHQFMAEGEVPLGSFDPVDSAIYDLDDTLVGNLADFLGAPLMEDEFEVNFIDHVVGKQTDKVRIIDKVAQPVQVDDQLSSSHPLYHFVIRFDDGTGGTHMASAAMDGTFVTQEGFQAGIWYMYDVNTFVIAGESKHDTLAQVRRDSDGDGMFKAILTKTAP
jgi:hypothetical protein